MPAVNDERRFEVLWSAIGQVTDQKRIAAMREQLATRTRDSRRTATAAAVSSVARVLTTRGPAGKSEGKEGKEGEETSAGKDARDGATTAAATAAPRRQFLVPKQAKSTPAQERELRLAALAAGAHDRGDDSSGPKAVPMPTWGVPARPPRSKSPRGRDTSPRDPPPRPAETLFEPVDRSARSRFPLEAEASKAPPASGKFATMVHILNRMGGVQDDGLPHTGHTSMLEAQRAGAGPRTAQPYYDPAAPYTPMQLQADMGGAGSGVGSIPMYPYGMPVGYGGDGSGSYLGMPGPYSLAPMPTGMHMGGGGYPMMGLPMGYSPAPYGAPYMVPQ